MKNLTFDLRPVGPSPIAVEAVTHRLYAAGDRSLIICVLSDAGTESETHIYIHTHTRHFKESDSWLSVHATKNTPSPQCTRCYSETTTPQINGSYKPDGLHCRSLNGWYSWWYNPHAAPRESPSSSLSLCFPRPPLGLMEQQRGLQATSTFQKRLLNRMWTIKGYLKQYEYISFKLWV